MYLYIASKRQPVGVRMREEYIFKKVGNLPGFHYFTCNVEASDIETLNELNDLIENFIKSKEK